MEEHWGTWRKDPGAPHGSPWSALRRRGGPENSQSVWVHGAAQFTPKLLAAKPAVFSRIRVVCKPRCQTSCPGDSQLAPPPRHPSRYSASPGKERRSWKQEEPARDGLTPPPSPPQRQEFLGRAGGPRPPPPPSPPPPPPPRPSPRERGGENLRDFPARSAEPRVSSRGAGTTERAAAAEAWGARRRGCGAPATPRAGEPSG